MSLINDLLRDLAEREPSKNAGDVLAGLRPVSAVPRRKRRWLAPAAAALLASSAYAILQSDSPVTVDAPIAVNAIPASLTGVAPVAVQADTSHQSLATLMQFTRSLDERAAAPRAVAPREDDLRASVPAVVTKREEPPVAKTSVSKIKTALMSREQTTAAPPVSITRDDPRQSGLAALAEGRPQDAEKHFRVLAERQPQSAESWLYLNRVLRAQGNSWAAESLLSEALVVVKDKAPLARALARHLLARKAVEEALGLLHAYRPTDKFDAEHDAFLAALEQRLGRHDIAAQYYRDVLRVRPQAAAWWVGLAISEEARGRAQDALDAYRHARNIGNLDARLANYAAQRIAAMQGSDQT